MTNRQPMRFLLGSHPIRRLCAPLVALLLGAVAGCAADPGAALGQHPDQPGVDVVPAAERQPAPPLSGTTLSDARFDLADHIGGAVILINVWASWCGPCRKEMPILVRAASNERDTGLLVVGIDERDKVGSARSFASSRGATYPSLVDTEGQLLHQLPTLPQAAVPSTLFIDSQGRIAARVIGPIDAHELESILSQLGTKTK